MMCSGCPKGFPAEPPIDSMRRDAIVHLSGALAEGPARAALGRRLGGGAATAAAPSPWAVARAIEHGVAVWSEARSRQYARKLYSILWALRCDPALLARADPWDLAFLREESLIHAQGAGRRAEQPQQPQQPPSQEPLQQVTAMLDALQETLKKRVERVSVVAKRACPRCGSHETERIAVQTRSADEGMTQMLQCTACGQRVRI
jgi:DNA-directed RNA polymerase subunit M/transcription elongation factor TFIIS